MNRAIAHQNQSLFFRQWSRKSYAIFASLGKEVQIGHIDVGICEKAIDKNNTERSFKKDCTDSLLNETDDLDELTLVNTDLQLMSLLSITSNSDESSQHCCSPNTKKYIDNINITSCFAGCR
jgi:hypothetical protein